jgi:hypothetical protein
MTRRDADEDILLGHRLSGSKKQSRGRAGGRRWHGLRGALAEMRADFSQLEENDKFRSQVRTSLSNVAQSVSPARDMNCGE